MPDGHATFQIVLGSRVGPGTAEVRVAIAAASGLGGCRRPSGDAPIWVAELGDLGRCYAVHPWALSIDAP